MAKARYRPPDLSDDSEEEFEFVNIIPDNKVLISTKRLTEKPTCIFSEFPTKPENYRLRRRIR